MDKSQWKSTQSKVQDEKGYPWLFLYGRRRWSKGLIVTCMVIATSGSFYVWYYQAGYDVTPDSIAGFCFAIAGTICFLLAAMRYTLSRKSPKRVMGQLNGALNWHTFFACMGFALLMMHSFGNFNAKTGTYALYGLVALMVSGFVGRVVDRIMPRLIAVEVDKILTAQGEDRIERISQDLQTFAASPSALVPTSSLTPLSNGVVPPQSSHSFSQMNNPAWNTSWDMAYRAPRNTPLPSIHNTGTRYFDTGTPNTSNTPPPSQVMLHARKRLAEVRHVQQATQKERLFRFIIVYWRRLHLFLAVIALGLIIWHLVYVAQLLLRGASYMGG